MLFILARIIEHIHITTLRVEVRKALAHCDFDLILIFDLATQKKRKRKKITM